MKRPRPRLLQEALRSLVPGLEPATTLGRVQGCWSAVAGPAVAEEATPCAERDGTLTVRCSSSVWAEELNLLSQELLERLNEALREGGDRAPITSLRFVASGSGDHGGAVAT